MPRVFYTKPALSYQDQLQQLKNRGLVVEDNQKAIFLLENISYYRLSGYWYPLLQEPKSSHLFKTGASFNQSFQLYCFDRDLRKLVSSELEKIEVAIRAKMIYILAHQYDPFWINDNTLFSDQGKFDDTNYKLKEEYKRSREDFILAFKAKYNDALPPSWMILEISSFGTLSNLYQNLKPGKSKRVIAKYFGLDDNTFSSWLHSIVYIRNICAHHSRLWNRTLSISPALPAKPKLYWLTITTTIDTRSGKRLDINNRTYYILPIIIYLLQTVNPTNTFKEKLFKLLSKYSIVDSAAMGFPVDWKDQAIWQ
ncbi:MAG: Abi family protein [Sphingobacteriaceae bacterium]|nr:MAG: Abi family protein [Sphingobacteriaceae bacterium]